MPIRLTFFDILLFAGLVTTFVIGIHQSIFHGVAQSYWLFMLSTFCFLWLNQRLKTKRQEAAQPPPTVKEKMGRKTGEKPK